MARMALTMVVTPGMAVAVMAVVTVMPVNLMAVVWSVAVPTGVTITCRA